MSFLCFVRESGSIGYMEGIPQLIPVEQPNSIKSVKKIKVGDILVWDIQFSWFPSTWTSHSIKINEIENGRYKWLHISNWKTNWTVELVYNPSRENFDIFIVKTNWELRSFGTFTIINKENFTKIWHSTSGRIKPPTNEKVYRVIFSHRDSPHFVDSDINDIPGIWEFVDTTRLTTWTIIQHWWDLIPPNRKYPDLSLVAQVRIGGALTWNFINLEWVNMSINCSIQRITRAWIVVAWIVKNNKIEPDIHEEYLLTDFRDMNNYWSICDMYINWTKNKIGVFHFMFSSDPVYRKAFMALLSFFRWHK